MIVTTLVPKTAVLGASVEMKTSRRPKVSQNHEYGEVLDKSRVKESLDTSERGLGYGIGALARELFGNKSGKGPIPKVLGAAVGGLSANTYEAREKYVNPRQTQNAQIPTQPTPSAMNR